LNEEIKYSGVLLAAGNSSRMNSWKPAAILDGKPLLIHSLQTLSNICKDVVVVGGYNINELNKLVNDNSNLFSSFVTCIENKEFNTGMFSSVKAGLTNSKYDNVFIALADMPFVSLNTYKKLKEYSESAADKNEVIYPVILNSQDSTNTKKGHPILIKKRVKERILRETGDVILRDILKEFKGSQCLVTDSGIYFDIDTEEDFEKAKNYYSHLKNK
jgi:molybdenum cofactor cytidylyltransferase